MQLLYMQFLAALRTAQQFLDAKAALLGPINATGARKTLDTSVATITTLAETQERHRILVTGQRTDEQRLSEAFRRKHLRPIVEIAKAKLPDQAELLSNLTWPPQTSNSTSLATKGEAMANAVTPFADIFIEAGLPQDFVAQIKTAADTLAKAVSSKGNLRSGRKGATDGITKEVRKARKAVRVLDAMVKAQLPSQEPLVTEWRDAVRVIRGGSAQPKQAPSPAPVTFQPVTQPEEVPAAS